MGFFDNLGKTLSDASQTALQKGKDIADVAKYNASIGEEEKKISHIYEEIGKQYVEAHREAPEEQFREYISLIDESKAKIEDYKQKLQELRGVTNCPTCGAEVPDGSLFCATCGAKVSVQVSQASARHCSACGAIVPDGSKFCTTCGAAVEVAAPVENSEQGE